MWTCNVRNCGNGTCIHKLLDEVCPLCSYKMVLVTTTGFKFCSNPDNIYGCDYEVHPKATDDVSAPASDSVVGTRTDVP